MFAPGDIVECVDARPFDAHDLPRIDVLTLHGLYTVRDFLPLGRPSIVPDPDKDGMRLCEIELPIHPVYGKEVAWNAVRFRHIYRPDPKLIALLQRAPSELETA